MKIKQLALVLCCFFILSGCGTEENSSVSPTPAVSQSGAFGDSTVDSTPVQEAQTTALPEADSAQEAAPESEATMHDYTEQAVTAAIICDAVDMLPYAPEDSMYLWRCVGYLAGQIGFDGELVTGEQDAGKLSAESVLCLAYAVDGNFSGQLPEVTEEDPLISTADDGSYLINMLEQGNLTLEMTENRLSMTGDSCTEEAQLLRDGESLGTYEVTLVRYTGTSTPGYFSYSIQSISPK